MKITKQVYCNTEGCEGNLEQDLVITGTLSGIRNELGIIQFDVSNTTGSEPKVSGEIYCWSCGEEFSADEVINLIKEQTNE